MRTYTQLTQSECGLACAAMLMSHGGTGPSLRQLREDHEPGREGMTVKQVIEVLARRGYVAKAFRVSGATRPLQLPTPFMAHWRRSHFVVVTGMSARGVRLVDPAVGPVRVAWEEFEQDFSGLAIRVVSRPSAGIATSHEPSPWTVLLPFIRASWVRLVGLVVATLASVGVTTTLPVLLGRVVDANGGSGTGGTAVSWTVGAALLGVLLTSLAAMVTSVTASVAVGRRVENGVFAHLLRLPYHFYTLRSQGDLLHRLSTAKELRGLITSDMVSGAAGIALVAGTGVAMASISPTLCLTAALMFVIVAGLVLVTRGPIGRLTDRELRSAAIGNQVQIDAVATASMAKTTGSEGVLLDAWVDANEGTLTWSRRRSLLEGTVNAILGFLQALGPVVITAGALAGILPAAGASLGQVLAFQALAAVCFSQAGVVGRLVVRAASARAMLARLGDILEQAPDDTFAHGTRTVVELDVTLRGVSFGYTRTGPRVLREVDLHIPAGSMVAIVGSSGSGKSSLARVVAGLYAPSAGAVLFGGHPLGSHRRADFYRQVAFVEQHAVLQNATIAENIGWGTSGLSADEVRAAARMAGIHDEIAAMQLGYDTLVTRLGENVSGGQRQRILLARALARSPRILVLDEATSALDRINEEAVMTRLRECTMTRIVVAHRLETVRGADLVVVVEGGQVVEVGPPAQLLDEGGAFARLHGADLSAPEGIRG